MTGGAAVILGTTGWNFAAGMSGGIAYVYDVNGDFATKVNHEMVDCFGLFETAGDQVLQESLRKHLHYTGSKKAKMILEDWEHQQEKFVKVYPREFHHINDVEASLQSKGLTGERLIYETFKHFQIEQGAMRGCKNG